MTSLNIMKDDHLIQKLSKQINERSPSQISSALASIRDLCIREDCRAAFGESGVVKTIFPLLCSGFPLNAHAAQTLAKLAIEAGPRKQIVEAGGNRKFINILQDEKNIQPEYRTAILQIVLELATDEVFQLAFRGANGLPCVVKILGESKDQNELEMACNVIGRLGTNDGSRNAVREQKGMRRMVQLLKRRDTQPDLTKAIVEAITVLVADNEMNQDHVREEEGVIDIVRLLDNKISKFLASSAISCVTALAINNQDVKDQVRELWAIPLLVNLLSDADAILAEKAVDCLRILTTGNERNQLALYNIPVAIRALVRIMTISSPTSSITERAAAVIGNMSTSEQFYGAIRECGGVQRLVVLLDSGAKAKVTEIAAKSLANMASNENNRKGMELAGGRPALVHLLTQRPSSEVIQATEEALRRLQMTDAERNVALETLRYCEQKHEAQQSEAQNRSECSQDAQSPHFTIPLTQFSVDQTCTLLTNLGITDTSRFRDNGVTGGDLLELSAEEMSESLNLSQLQVKKLRTLVNAFEAFEKISLTPGSGDITLVELQDWLQKQGREKEEIQAIVYGFKKAVQEDNLLQISFSDFARHYQWLMKTNKAMALS